ncbi:hypothetical protein NP603_13775 [Methylomonas sp. SURF-1]|uniref:DUF2730 family protein n=1 Tax=Methylomonas aurea TaxID=2952224 RepID=A0ABT1UJI0_9GAMM|nr:hypothetical protein [Methylomonas sp. SURF-1]MCQ8182186.1 hypothetical protein [Methylomonas sp. SURF-1]
MIEWIKLGLTLANFFGGIAVFIYLRADRNQRATVKSINDLAESVNKRFGEKCERLARLEGEVKTLPTRDQLEREREVARSEIIRIHERIDELNKSAQQTQLLLGQVLGELKQLNKGLPHG